MTITTEVAEIDPRYGNAARELLLSILASLDVPENHRVVLGVDSETDKLKLKVLKRKPHIFKLFGKWTIWTSIPSWDETDCLKRSLVGRTYESLLEQLKAQPEFLEFDTIVAGPTEIRTIALF
jgi:hypothetical protein